jgi:hypothetical protein
VEAGADLAFISIAALRSAAFVAENKAVEEARIQLISTQRLIQRAMRTIDDQKAYLAFVKHGERLDGYLREVLQRQEVKKLFQQADDTEADDYNSRNLIQTKSFSLVDFFGAK